MQDFLLTDWEKEGCSAIISSYKKISIRKDHLPTLYGLSFSNAETGKTRRRDARGFGGTRACAGKGLFWTGGSMEERRGRGEKGGGPDA